MNDDYFHLDFEWEDNSENNQETPLSEDDVDLSNIETNDENDDIIELGISYLYPSLESEYISVPFNLSDLYDSGLLSDEQFRRLNNHLIKEYRAKQDSRETAKKDLELWAYKLYQQIKAAGKALFSIDTLREFVSQLIDDFFSQQF